jgi:3-hydroxymyristoyl/3-hydroxydecanoyl-(acyl carrier protein) dehydratase
VIERRETQTVPGTHPCLPGHFPGIPIVPAVVLLERVHLALQHALGSKVRLAALPAVKFMSPVAPDTPFDIELSIEPEARSARFRIACGGRDCVTGRIGYREAGS